MKLHSNHILIKFFSHKYSEYIDNLTPSIKRSQLLFLFESVIINIAYILTTGIFISGYAMYIGASDLVTGILNNSLNFTTLISVFSFLIFERLQKWKKSLMWMNFLSRLLIFVIIFIPITNFNSDIKIIMLCMLVIISDSLWSIYRVGWLIWTMDFVAESSKSKYIYIRILLIRIFTCITSLLAGFIVDHFNKGYTGFAIIFSVSFLLSIFDILILSKIGDINQSPERINRVSVKSFFEPLNNKKYRNLLILCFLIYLFYIVSTAYNPVYLIKHIGINYKAISFANILSIIVMIFTGGYWRKLEITKGTIYTVKLMLWVIIAELLVFSFLSKSTSYLIVITSILMGVGMGGFAVFVMSIRYSLMPQYGKSIYEGWFYFVYGISTLIAPFFGGILLKYMEGKVTIINKFQGLYIFSFLCVLIVTLLITISVNINNKSNT